MALWGNHEPPSFLLAMGEQRRLIGWKGSQFFDIKKSRGFKRHVFFWDGVSVLPFKRWDGVFFSARDITLQRKKNKSS